MKKIENSVILQGVEYKLDADRPHDSITRKSQVGDEVRLCQVFDDVKNVQAKGRVITRIPAFAYDPLRGNLRREVAAEVAVRLPDRSIRWFRQIYD